MIKNLFSVLLIFLLSGCNSEEKNYSWYMQHPLELRQAFSVCKIDVEQQKNKMQCEMITQAVKNVTALINQQQEDPEEFGQRILDAEECFAQLESEAIKERNTLNEFKNNSSDEFKHAQDNLDKANKAWQEQGREVAALLAVVGLSSPD